MFFHIIFSLVQEQLNGFGVSNEVIKRVIRNKESSVTTEEVCLDEDHPPPEALGYALSHIKPYVSKDAWKKIISSSMSWFRD